MWWYFHSLCIPDECKDTPIDLDRLSSVVIGVRGRGGSLPVCLTYVSVTLGYNEDSEAKDRMTFFSTFRVCSHGEVISTSLIGGELYFG